MSEGTPLGSILSDEPLEPVEAQVAEAETEQPETPEAPAEGQPRDDRGRFAAKDTGDEPQTAAEPTPGDNPIPDDQFKGYLTEKRKRQELEEKLAALERQIQQQQPKEPAAPPPSIWEDEQGAFQHFGGQIVTQATFNARLDMSEMLASQAHDDFDDMKGRFIQMMEANPALQQQALEAKHPWEKAYQIAKNAAQAEELGAVNVADLEARLREKIMAEMQQGQTPVQQPQAVIPPTLTGERNVGSRAGPAWTGPRTLNELLS